eukprot:3884839-Pleurochrysis_carterae.AAC.2
MSAKKGVADVWVLSSGRSQSGPEAIGCAPSAARLGHGSCSHCTVTNRGHACLRFCKVRAVRCRNERSAWRTAQKERDRNRAAAETAATVAIAARPAGSAHIGRRGARDARAEHGFALDDFSTATAFLEIAAAAGREFAFGVRRYRICLMTRKHRRGNSRSDAGEVWAATGGGRGPNDEERQEDVGTVVP